ncbi:MAG TPA: FtsX-like permease family protein [Streptosporangiaceae bacterium]|jgi:cell division protein FtsX
MIRLGLRLTLNGGREALIRLIILVVSVGLGTGLLLISVSGINAVNHQNGRYAWLESSASSRGQAAPEWWLVTADYYQGQVIARVDVAATGTTSPVPPGLPRVPAAGQYYASPALAALLRTLPRDQLADRFPGRLAGVIGDAALPAPNSLAVVVGYIPATLSHVSGAQKITAMSTTPPSGCSGNSSCLIGVGLNANAIDLVLCVIALALLFPVLMFTGSATRLSAARREQRFAAMRLAGGTPRQIALIACVEAVLSSVVGTGLGFGLFYVLLRAPLASIPFTGAPFFPSDLSLSLIDVLLVGLGVPVAAAVVALLALRRVNISPLGVTRRVTPRPPGVWRVLPLLAGLGLLGWYVVAGRPHSTGSQIQAFMPSFVLVMAGLVLIGPWLTMIGARLAAARTRKPAALIAARRLGDNPKAAFRAVSGLVLALFITTVAVVSITTINANASGTQPTPAARAVLLDQAFDGDSANRVPAALLARLDGTPGVTGTMVVYQDPQERSIPPRTVGLPATRYGSLGAGLVSCAQLDRVRILGRCPAGAEAALFPVWGLLGNASSATLWPGATLPSGGRLTALTIVTGTDGTTAAIETARTILDNAYPAGEPPLTIGEISGQDMVRYTQYQRLADVVILTALPIAGCTLAASLAGGLADRKRPFSLLRLTGAPLGMLRRVVTLESAVPLLGVAVISIAAGFGASALFLRAQMGYTLSWPGAAYYLMTAAGVVLSLAIIAATFPLLARITGPDVARNE